MSDEKRARRKLAAPKPVAVQVAGGATAAVGLYLLVGLAWALLALGVGLVVLGALREARVI